MATAGHTKNSALATRRQENVHEQQRRKLEDRRMKKLISILMFLLVDIG